MDNKYKNFIIGCVIVAFIALCIFLSQEKLPKIILSLDFRKNGVENIREFVSDGTNIWFTDSVNNSIICFKKSDGSFVRKLTNEVNSSYNFAFPLGMAFDGVNIWVANVRNNSVTGFRALDGIFIKNLSEPEYNFADPCLIAYDSINKNMWVSNNRSDSVTCFNSSNGDFVKNINYFNKPYAITFDGNNMLVINDGNNSVTCVNVNDNTDFKVLSAKSTDISNDLKDSCSDGTHIWVIDSGANSILAFNAKDGSSLKNIESKGKYNLDNPEGIVCNAENLYVKNRDSLLIYNTKTGKFVHSINTFISSAGMCFDGNNIWIGDGTSKVMGIKIKN
jgi:hypothetical protein